MWKEAQAKLGAEIASDEAEVEEHTEYANDEPMAEDDVAAEPMAEAAEPVGEETAPFESLDQPPEEAANHDNKEAADLLTSLVEKKVCSAEMAKGPLCGLRSCLHHGNWSL